MKKVWLIDDDLEDREVFEMALASLELPTRFFYSDNGETALEQVASTAFQTPDYIFLDLNMPKLGGLAFLSEIRSRNICHDVPVFIYTTSSMGTDIDACIRMGGVLVTKHSSFAALCADLQKLLS